MSVFSLLLVFLSCDSDDETINNEKINTNNKENSVSVEPKNITMMMKILIEI